MSPRPSIRIPGVDRLASRLRARMSSSGRGLPSMRANVPVPDLTGVRSGTRASPCTGKEPAARGRTPPAMVQAARTLVKSGPELWAELSDPAALGRHLEPFGDVRPVDAEGETLVAWEG